MQSIKPGRKTVKMRKALAVSFPALLAAVCIGTALFFGLRIYDTCRQDAESERAYGEMAQYVVPCKEQGKTAVPETPLPGFIDCIAGRRASRKERKGSDHRP